MNHDEFKYKEETYRIQGAVFAVYHELKSGFLESVYHECLEREFISRGIPYVSQQIIELEYRGQKLVQTFKADFVCFGCVLLELKAVDTIAPQHSAQILHYLKATKLPVGLLINFGSHTGAEVKRFINF